MKRLALMALAILLCLGMVSCSPAGEQDKPDEEKRKPNECHLNETVAFENGVEFAVTSIKETEWLGSEFSDYYAGDGNRFIIATVKVANNSKGTYSAYSDEIWIDWNGTKIEQDDNVFSIDDGFYIVSQNATLTDSYRTIFRIAESVETSDLALVIDNGSWLDNERVKIWLTEK